MKISLVKKANNLYLNGEYREALTIYEDLGRLLGKHLFRANIELCERKLKAQNGVLPQSSKKVNIAFISDDNYAIPTYVALYSLLKNKKKDVEIDIYVIGVNLSPSHICNIKSLQFNKFSISIIETNESNSQFTISKEGFHVSSAAIAKFNLPTILPHLDKILYLDGDVIVRSDLSQLYDLDINEFYAAVVPDIKPTLIYKPSILDKLKINDHRYYFNSGVLLLNLKAMRSDDLTTKLFNYRKTGINFFMDQDALNVVLGNKVKYLSCKYNFLMTLHQDFTPEVIIDEYQEKTNAKSHDDLIRLAHILHFASKDKPWMMLQGYFAHSWLKYYFSSGASIIYKMNIVQDTVKHNIENIIVSLTSYPARIETVHLTINSLLSQTFKPSKVLLWLAREEFPGGENSLPRQLLSLKTSGLSINWHYNIRSYKKLIPTLKAYPDNVIVTVDDDIIYKKTWLEQLVASYIQYPDSIHCCRAHEIKLNDKGELMPYRNWRRDIKWSEPSCQNFFTGCGGVLYPPSSLHENVTDEKVFMKLCMNGDDIWFWGMAILKHTKIRIVPDNDFELDFTPNSQDCALWKINDTGGENDLMIKKFILNYPSLVSLLKHDLAKIDKVSCMSN